jgi:hypothetical protein
MRNAHPRTAEPDGRPPDLAVVSAVPGTAPGSAAAGSRQILEVELPMALPVRETYLEVRGVADGDVVTVVELLSPANKRPGTGRRLYLDKRTAVLATGTSLVEIDLLRAGERMPTLGPPIDGDYRMIVGRGWRRPRAQVIAFGVRDSLPPFAVPLRRGRRAVDRPRRVPARSTTARATTYGSTIAGRPCRP